MDETQETLRTSAFPSTHVKVYASIIHAVYLGTDFLVPCFCLSSNLTRDKKNFRKNGWRTCIFPRSATGELCADVYVEAPRCTDRL
jgi:hypothetical protein